MSPMVPARALDPAWVALIERLAPRVLGRDDRTGEPLAAEIRALSALYTRERDAMERAGEALAARLRFFLPRDLPKVQGPLAELARADALPARWRVLDVGAGLGASALGVAEFAKRAGVDAIELVAIERDEASLDVLTQLARAASEAGLVPPIRLDARRAKVEGLDLPRLPQADLVIVGLVLNELYADRDEADRLDAKEAFLRDLAGRLSEDGALIVIEPALRGPTRELQRLRDRFAADRSAPHVFAPCLRDGPCPLLRRERDWCHDQLPFDLPAPTAALAEAASLRTERLTYSYLTLRNHPRRLWDVADRDRRVFRIVGGPVDSKGKTEWDACGEPGLVRLRRIDRERSDANAAMDGAARGALVALDREPADESQLRFRPGVTVRRVDDA